MVVKKQNIENIVFGVHPIVELLRAKKRKIITLYTTRPVPKRWPVIQSILPAYPINIRYITREQLAQLAGTTDHQGFVVHTQPFVYYMQPFNSTKQQGIVVLDGIQDPRNLGAIIRSASCTNTHGILIVQKNAAPLNGVALKAAAGLAEHMLIRIVSSAAVALKELQTAGYTVYCGHLDGTDIRTIPFKLPYAIVIGSEGVGISPAFIKVGQLVTIPQRTGTISYNASVAAGLLLFTAASQHKLI
jgi:23S rRNA (guanosine2251-2'-O)-methyltransferase